MDQSFFKSEIKKVDYKMCRDTESCFICFISDLKSLSTYFICTYDLYIEHAAFFKKE